ncbi:molecular chaperone [Cytobacillus sp. Hz8]|uniref:TorD/DmsD family molecular chaperone n=1 Tax=Cytobacillus sp. Hz8 TaxID=3347168 RepID=UPI0035D64D57
MPSTVEYTTKELQIQNSVAASDMYRLLSMFLHLPKEEMAIGILDGSLAEDVVEIFMELGVYDSRIEIMKAKLDTLQEGKSSTKEVLTDMRQEYTRLFTHPKKPAIEIYETTFLFNPSEENKEGTTLFISPAALDAERCYNQAGLIRSMEVNEPSDHMATELEFMAFLYLQKGIALKDNNFEKVIKRNEQIKEFSEIHLQKWAMKFFDRCSSSSESAIYQIFGHIGGTFLSIMLES